MGFGGIAENVISRLLRRFANGKDLVLSFSERFSWTGIKNECSPMIVTLTRTNKTADGIFGNLMIDTDPFKCVTLENLTLSIPSGTFDVLYRYSPHFQQIMPHIIVPNRTDILFHWANWPNQLLGCVALGTGDELQNDMITESKDAWIRFAQAITDEPALKLVVKELY